jgi:glucose-6-phosphate-specific signal transduction histidine kinase
VASDFALTINTLGQELASGQTNPNAAKFHVEVEGTAQNLHPTRDEVYRIAGKAMRNAFKHAQARQIEVEIRYDERQLRCGSEMTERALTRSILMGGSRWALRFCGMPERAKLMG